MEVRAEVVALTVGRAGLEVLTVERRTEPFAGLASLPNTVVGADESIDAAAARILLDEVGPPLPHMEQLATYGDVGRDPLRRTVAVGYLAILPLTAPGARREVRPSSHFVPVAGIAERGVDFAFDHRRIIEDGTERLRSKLEYTTLAAAFLPEEFTLGELRRLYEVVWGTALHHGNFARKVRSVAGFVVPTGRRRATPGAPDLFRPGPAETMAPPLTRRSVVGTPGRAPEVARRP